MTPSPKVEDYETNFRINTIVAISKRKPGDAINLYEFRGLSDEKQYQDDTPVHYYLTGADIRAAKKTVSYLPPPLGKGWDHDLP